MIPKHLVPWSPGGSDVFDSRKAAHLLRRAGFGGTSEQISRAVHDGLESTVEGLFDEAGDEEREFARTFEAISGSLIDFDEVEQLRAWWVHRMVRTRVPLREKLTLFWHGHFATGFEKVDNAQLMARQLETIRRLAWGDFRDLALAMAKDPAMLVWLDGESNTKAHPNENFARELMELFTCGIGNYTEADVQAAARAFTGWHREGPEFVFHPDDHDSGRKKFLGKAGRFDGGDVVDLLIQHPATPHRIASKLVRFFAAPEPAPDVIDEAAALLERTRLDIKWFLRELFQSRFFFSDLCLRKRISSPTEFAVGAVRSLGVRWASTQVAEQMKQMGQALLEPPNVKGWDGEQKWINSSTWAARITCAKVISQLEDDGPFGANLDLGAIVPAALREPAEVVDRLAEVLLQGELSPETRKELVDSLTVDAEGQPSQAFRDDEGVRNQKTRGLLALILALPEYHAC